MNEFAFTGTLTQIQVILSTVRLGALFLKSVKGKEEATFNFKQNDKCFLS